MKFSISAALASAILATTVAADTLYNLRVSPVSGNPAIKDSFLAVKDESTTTSLSPLGIWSTGEPRYPYTFTIEPNPANNQLFEMKNAVKATHAILFGPDAAMAFADVPTGADPTLSAGQLLRANTFTKFGNGGRVLLAERYVKGGDPKDLIGAGTWRACKGHSEIDYQIVWFDGENILPFPFTLQLAQYRLLISALQVSLILENITKAAKVSSCSFRRLRRLRLQLNLHLARSLVYRHQALLQVASSPACRHR